MPMSEEERREMAIGVEKAGNRERPGKEKLKGKSVLLSWERVQ